jgi:hypothetical protein
MQGAMRLRADAAMARDSAQAMPPGESQPAAKFHLARLVLSQAS